MARAYREDHDPELPHLARATIADWMDQRDPYGPTTPMGPGDNTLNLSIRLGQPDRWGWWHAAIEFIDSEAFDAAFIERMRQSTRGQLDYLRTHLSPRGNWRISQLNCLLFASLVLPGFADLADDAAAGLREAIYRQVESDGAHCEHTPSYHGWMARVALCLWRLGRARPELPLQIDGDRLVRMWDYSLASAAPDGGSAGLHDSGIWNQGKGLDSGPRDAVAADVGIATWDREAEPSRWFPDAGQLFLRDGWQPESTFISFDATRWGGGHCHLGRLAVSLYAGGRMLLVDPGIFSYEMSDPFAVYGKSTPAHNTVTVNGWNQCPANPDGSRVLLLPHYAYAQSTYAAGYYPGEYRWGFNHGLGHGRAGTHTRSLLWVKGRYALVIDHVQVDGSEVEVAAHWQFPAGPSACDPERQQAWTCGADSNILVHCLHSSVPVNTRLCEGQTDPPRGWLPTDVHGGRQPAPQLVFSAPTGGLCLVTLLLPFAGEAAPDYECRQLDQAGTVALELRWPGQMTDLLVINPGLAVMAGVCGEVETDGLLALAEKNHGQTCRAFLLDGFQLTVAGEQVINQSRGGVYEWVRDTVQG